MLHPAGDADRLRHGPCERGERRLLTMRTVEHMHISERARELGEQLRAGPAEGTGRDVGVTEGQNGDAAATEALDHRDPTPSELLRVVDQHHAQGRQGTERRRVRPPAGSCSPH